MTEARTTGLSPFMYAIIRVVPDPIRDEAINVGVVVTPTEGSGGRMRVSNRVRTRIRSLQPDYGFDALDQTLEDLRHALGLDPQPELSESAPAPATARLLEDAAK